MCLQKYFILFTFKVACRCNPFLQKVNYTNVQNQQSKFSNSRFILLDGRVLVRPSWGQGKLHHNILTTAGTTTLRSQERGLWLLAKSHIAKVLPIFPIVCLKCIFIYRSTFFERKEMSFISCWIHCPRHKVCHVPSGPRILLPLEIYKVSSHCTKFKMKIKYAQFKSKIWVNKDVTILCKSFLRSKWNFVSASVDCREREEKGPS